MLTLKEVTSKVMNAIGWKVNTFTFPTRKDAPPKEDEACFYVDDTEGDRRFWFHITESAIPKGTTLRLSEVDENQWKELALKHIKVKVKKVKEPGAKGTARRSPKLEEL